MFRRAIVAAIATGAAALCAPAAALAVPPAGGYQEDDFGGGRTYNIVPPGQNGFANAADVAEFLATGNRPPHQYDQNDMYANLVYASPGLKGSEILDFFKDGSFGARPVNRESSGPPEACNLTLVPPAPRSPHCDDVRIVRDEFGVPHVYGENRAALMFGLGYVTAEDRLFLADALRHAGRGQLSSFAGGANVGQDRETFTNAPYRNDAELLAQYERADELYGGRGRLIQRDVQNYVDGFNHWIALTRTDPVNKLDALYAATNHPEGPQRWKVTDVVATGALVAGIFGKGGGDELGAATALQDAKRVLGPKRGRKSWSDFRSADDPEAPRTVARGEFPYRVPDGRKGIAMPDRGSVRELDVVAGSSAPASSERDPAGELLGGLEQIGAGSNALLVSGRESASGHPIAVFGPQTGYFAPQLLIEQDAHAPGGPHGPAIDARGVAFVGTNLYVQLGRGQDYAWSATSAGQDIIDTFAVELCEPDGSSPTRNSRHYVYGGQCLAMDRLTRTNSWEPNVADQTPPGSETMRMFRTKAGLVSATATIDGVPHAYTKLRATYNHEVDSAISFAHWNSPDKVTDAESWTRHGYLNDLTFNWFYADDEEIAYFNSGANPKRAKGTHPNFPVLAKPRFMWKGYDPELNTFKRDPIGKHAQVIDQRYLTSWNNKQAKGYRCDGIRCFSPVYRVDPLDRKIEQGIKGRKKMSLVELIDAAEDSGTTDVRGMSVVPSALKMIGKPKGDRKLRRVVRELRGWVRSGANRVDRDNNGQYDHAKAVRTIDAWWPLWVRQQFVPVLGKDLYKTFIGSGSAIHDAPGPIGSAFQNTVYGFVQKDLRSILGEKVKQPYSRGYCGRGKAKRCRKVLRRTLRRAAGTSFPEVYGNEGCDLNNGTQASPQMCNDAVDPTDLTAAAVGQFHWINRPTFQQAVEFRSGR